MPRQCCRCACFVDRGSVCGRGDAEGSGELKEGERDVFKRTGGNFGIGGGMGISSHRGSFLLSYTFVLSETDREGENRNGGCGKKISESIRYLQAMPSISKAGGRDTEDLEKSSVGFMNGIPAGKFLCGIFGNISIRKSRR